MARLLGFCCRTFGGVGDSDSEKQSGIFCINIKVEVTLELGED